MIMRLSSQGLRKAAILVASLDTAAADAVLDQLTAEQARQVREIVVEMNTIDQGEQRRVIDEFFQVAPKAAVKPSAGVELDGRLAWLAARGPAELGESPPLKSDERPFRFLQETEAEKLIRVLGIERPQTIALVLSHLSPARAGAVLSRLPDQVQVEVIHRLVDLEETDPDILREVEEALRGRLSQQVEMQRRRTAGLQAVAGILEATNGRVGMKILDNLAHCDRALAEKLGPRSLQFNDLADMDGEVLAAVLEEAGPGLMLPALFGAPPELVHRFLAPLPQADARAIRHKLDHPDPIRLSDVEEARREIAQIATRLNYRVTHTTLRAA
jgi:flagellar motor switch protein FliG